jgi:osmotically-inducible protein OsmY
MSDDYQVQHAVLAELKWEPSVTAAHIGVTANDGVVTLTGHVESFAEKHAAQIATLRVKDVRAVADEIRVRLPVQTVRGDGEIAASAIERLAWDVSVPADAIKVSVIDGWVTLGGEVAWHFQRDAAEQDVRRLFGVVGVSNQIAIKTGVDPQSISDDIMHALNRSWFFDPRTIEVGVTDGKVLLTGTVRSPHDRQIAAATAWAASGVTDVQNDIAISIDEAGGGAPAA